MSTDAFQCHRCVSFSQCFLRCSSCEPVACYWWWFDCWFLWCGSDGGGGLLFFFGWCSCVGFSFGFCCWCLSVLPFVWFWSIPFCFRSAVCSVSGFGMYLGLISGIPVIAVAYASAFFSSTYRPVQDLSDVGCRFPADAGSSTSREAET